MIDTQVLYTYTYYPSSHTAAVHVHQYHDSSSHTTTLPITSITHNFRTPTYSTHHHTQRLYTYTSNMTHHHTQLPYPSSHKTTVHLHQYHSSSSHTTTLPINTHKYRTHHIHHTQLLYTNIVVCDHGYGSCVC